VQTLGRRAFRRPLSASEVDVLEIHEAFAGQVLANFNALNSASWAWAPDGGAGTFAFVAGMRHSLQDIR
jgi:acetyl-CoA acetyltransferase